VKSEYDKLQSAFDSRPDENVSRLLASYDNDEAIMTEKAKPNAAKTRDQALNLKRPHCNTVYIGFEGCMALKCSTCRKIFCGYCHQKVQTTVDYMYPMKLCWNIGSASMKLMKSINRERVNILWILGVILGTTFDAVHCKR